MLATHNNSLLQRYSWILDIAGLGLVFGIFYTLLLGHYPLFIPDEGRYSEVAREMLATGDFITPRVNGVAFLDKPALYYWLQALGMHWFGVNEWGIRFFPAMLGVAGSLVTYATGRTLYNRLTGLLAGIILILTPLYFGGAHYADLNMEVAVFISCTLLAFLSGINSSGKTRTSLLIASYFLAACAFLTKGLIGIAFPAMIAGTWIILTWQWSLLKRIHLISGLILFTVLVLPWYLLVQQANPGFFHYFFVTQQVTRFLSAGTFNNPSPVWFYLPVILVGFLPWTLFLAYHGVKNILAVMRQTLEITHDEKKQINLFLGLWIVIVTIFFSIPKAKTVGYIFPVFPPLALLTAKLIADHWQHYKIAFYTATISTIIFLTGVLIIAPTVNDHSTKLLAMQLKPVLQPGDEVANYNKFYQDLPIYLEKRMTLVADWQSPEIAKHDNWMRELWFGMPFQDTSSWLINENTFWQRWNDTQHRVFVFLKKDDFNEFKSHARYYFYLGMDNDVILLSNSSSLYAAKWVKDDSLKNVSFS